MKIGWLWLVVPLWAQAQFVAVESGDKDNGFARTELHINTMDRTLVPLVTETRRRQVSETRTETDTVTQTRLADGTYFASQRRHTVTEKVSPSETRITTEVAETDRQGQTRIRRQMTETVLTTAGGEQRARVETTRNSSGDLVLDRQITETISRQPDGSLRAQRVEHERDVNGKLVPKREVAEQTVERAPNEKVTTSQIYSYDHLTGRLAEIGREETIVKSTANTTQSTRLIHERVGTTWVVKGRVETSEVQTPTGIERETIQYGRSLHSGRSDSSADPLRPRLKIVERAVAGPEGTTRVEREVYRRDVNGEWKPESFRAESPAAAQDADDP
jgi:hypothetical protein